jgi:hypothetical protein
MGVTMVQIIDITLKTINDAVSFDAASHTYPSIDPWCPVSIYGLSYHCFGSGQKCFTDAAYTDTQ